MRGLRVSEILDIADRLFPFRLAEPWDNCGIQIGDPDHEVSSIAFSLDPSHTSIEFAEQNGNTLLITHHPVLLEPLRNLVTTNYSSSVLVRAAQARVNIISLHTNFDAAPGGLNDYLANTIGLENTTIPLPASCARFGKLPAPETVYRLAARLADTFNSPCLRLVADEDRLVQTVFCASGSGMGYWPDVLRCKADVMVTGDVRYHAAAEALDRSIPVIDVGHFALEKFAPGIMASAFNEEFELMGSQVACIICELEKDPFLNIHHL